MLKCKGCGRSGSLLCRNCSIAVNSLYQPKAFVVSGAAVTSYFCYEGVIRRLILNAKADADWATARLCRALFIQAAILDQAFCIPETVVTAPANMKSRFKLRLSLAEYLGAGLADFFGCPWRRAPWFLHYKTKKRAEDHSHKAEGPVVTKLRLLDKKMKLLWKVAPKRENLILVIDDVVTTGFTMASICAEQSKFSRGLAFCYAPSLKVLSNGLCVTD